MGTYSTWFNLIEDPNDVEHQVYLALAALDQTIDELFRALFINFTSVKPVYSGVTNVANALDTIADEVATLGATNPPVISGYDVAALVDATLTARWHALYTGSLGLGSFYVTTAPTGGTCTLDLSKNGSTVATITIPESINGPVTVDFSNITYVADDVFTLTTTTVNTAEGLSYLIQV